MHQDLTIGYILAGRKDASRTLAKRVFSLPFTAPLVLRTLAGLVTEVAPFVQHLGWDELRQGEVPKKFLKNVDLVFLSGLTTATYGMQRIAESAKELGVPVVAGGSGVTCKYFGGTDISELSKHYNAVCIGRATPRIIAEIIQDYAYRQLKPMYTEQADEPVSFPIPDHKLFRGRYLFNNVLQSSIGCSSACSFCVVHRCSPGGKRCQIYCTPADVIQKQLETFVDYGGGRFFDGADSFGEDEKHTYEVVLPRYTEYPGSWLTEAKINVLKGKDGKWKLLKKMAKAGNMITYAGFEDLFHKFTAKQVDISDIEEFIRVARGEGITPIGSLMLDAAPDAKPEDIDKMINWVCKNKVDAQFSLSSVLESSTLWKQVIQKGTLIDINPEDTCGAFPQISHWNMSPEFLIKSLERCYKECYSFTQIYARLRMKGFSKDSIIATAVRLGINISVKSWFKDHDYMYYLDNRVLPPSLRH